MIKQVRIPQHTPEWYKFRYENGFGGSDIASVVATRSQAIAELTYTSPIKQFLQMIGEPVQEFTGNIASESGHYFENIILHWLKYFDINDGDQLAMLRRVKQFPLPPRCKKIIKPK